MHACKIGCIERKDYCFLQVVLAEVRGLQVVKAGRLNLLPAAVMLPASAVRFTAASSCPSASAGATMVPGPAAEGLVFELAALEQLQERSGELQTEHVRTSRRMLCLSGAQGTRIYLYAYQMSSVTDQTIRAHLNACCRPYKRSA